MSMRRNGYKAMFTIDALVTLIPIVVMVYIGISSFAIRGYAANVLYQDNAMLNLIEASDYMIRESAVCENSMCHINWVKGMVSREYYTGFEPMQNASCIYRIVNYIDKGDIRKVYVCKR